MKPFVLFISTALILLSACSKHVVEPISLESKELDWKIGDVKIYHVFDHSQNDTSFFDTLTVTQIAEVDGYRTITWAGSYQRVMEERVRDGVFEFRNDFGDVWDQWRAFAKLPSFLGELLDTDEYTRTATDGSYRGKFRVEFITSCTDTTITVPAGTFRCMASIGHEYSLPDHVLSDGMGSGYWYAPGVGYVQIETYDVTHTGGRKTTLRGRMQLVEIYQ